MRLMKIFNKQAINDFVEPALEYTSKFGSFGLALLEYILRKIDYFLLVVADLSLNSMLLITGAKFRAVSTLIWSGGRMGRSMRYFFVVLFVWAIFLAGGVFQGRLVQYERQDRLEFVAGGSVILAEASAATRFGETFLLDAPIEHVVEEDETLISIGQQYNISIESIKFANNLVSDNVRVGQSLTIPPVEGTTHTVARGDTVESLGRRYNVPSQTIVDFNYLDAPYELVVGQVITVPNARPPAPASAPAYAGRPVYDTSAYGIIPQTAVAVQGTGRFMWPFSGPITQRFSAYHPAIDIGGRTGDILAADEGLVVRAGWWQGGYGNAVQIDHGNGYVSTYAHMSSIAVSAGQTVSKGQKLGVVGSTGRSTGPHLHFTIQFEGRFLDPLSQL